MMKLQNLNPALRQALNLKNYSHAKHRQEIERLAETHHHTIRFIAQRCDETCAPYALCLTDDPTYRAIARCCNVFAGKDFMGWASERHLQEIDQERPNCLICYFSVAGWQHVGVIGAIGRVTSKWGTYPLYEHGLAEVSEEYGDCVRFFERPAAYEALSLFIEFAHERGLSDHDIAKARSQWELLAKAAAQDR